MHSDLHPAILQHGVMIVDDSAVQRMAVSELLFKLGITNIHEACDGNMALELLRHLPQTPAIAIVDLEMPGMDGIDLLQHLAEEKNCPALLVTSSVDATILDSVGTMARELDLPVLNVLTKPLSLENVRATLQRFVLSGSVPSVAEKRGPGEIELELLRSILAEGGTFPYYQPQMNLATGRVDSIEALCRCIGPDGKLIPPLRFIGLAERNNLIDELTLCMLDSVLADLGRWQNAGVATTVSLNISAQSLCNRHFADEIIRRVSVSPISPRSIVLEITESALFSDLASAIGTLGRLRLKGFGLSIDDYGTGFSSMQQLSRLPFTELKIDQSFVRHANEKPNLCAILTSAIEVGRRLGLATVAEGVETREELALLKSLGCSSAQGYLVARPMPAEEIVPWLNKSLSLE